MRIVICEDSINDQNHLTKLIKSWAKEAGIENKIDTYDSAKAFWFAWPDIVADIVFLDIELEKTGKNGFALANDIRKEDPDTPIVFTTSHQQYSLKGYDYFPLHYLIKPLTAAKLYPILDKALAMSSSNNKEVFIYKEDSGIVRLPNNNIHYIMLKSHQTTIQLQDREVSLRKNGEELLNQLPAHFVRCHRSYIVNLLKIESVDNHHALLSSGTYIPVSRGKSKKVREAFYELHK